MGIFLQPAQGSPTGRSANTPGCRHSCQLALAGGQRCTALATQPRPSGWTQDAVIAIKATLPKFAAETGGSGGLDAGKAPRRMGLGGNQCPAVCSCLLGALGVEGADRARLS